MTFDQALENYHHVGAARCEDEALMANFCQNVLQTIVGAVSPRLVWEGALKSRLTTLDLARMAQTDPMKVSNLQWV